MKQIAVRRRQLPRLELDQIAHRRRAEVVRPVAFGQHGAGEDAAVRLRAPRARPRGPRAASRRRRSCRCRRAGRRTAAASAESVRCAR